MTDSGLRNSPRLGEPWPALPLEAWQDTYDTLHMWLQIAGKIRMEFAPPQNHWWNTALYVTTRGLTTSPIPYQSRAFELQFDFIDHNLVIQTSEGGIRAVKLASKPVAEFYGEVMSSLHAEGIQVAINTKPQEVANPIPFDQDETHRSYDAEYANRFWRILLSTHAVLQEFRAEFLGKSSPVHFFWGSCDLACTRFSGRPAPPRKGVITSEAYSEECSSIGWWPGGADVKGPAFYAYMAPEPPQYGEQRVQPDNAFYSRQLREFLLMYDDVRSAKSPRAEILEFAHSIYEAGADLADWNRASLEKNLSSVRAT